MAVSAGRTVISAVTARMLVTLGWSACRVFLGMVFVIVPEVVKSALTVSVMVQVPSVVGVGLAGMAPPVKFKVVGFTAGAVVIVPLPQVVVGVPVKVKPAGNVSEILTPV